jgi:hypothetical protein
MFPRTVWGSSLRLVSSDFGACSIFCILLWIPPKLALFDMVSLFSLLPISAGNWKNQVCHSPLSYFDRRHISSKFSRNFDAVRQWFQFCHRFQQFWSRIWRIVRLCPWNHLSHRHFFANWLQKIDMVWSLSILLAWTCEISEHLGLLCDLACKFIVSCSGPTIFPCSSWFSMIMGRLREFLGQSRNSMSAQNFCWLVDPRF